MLRRVHQRSVWALWWVYHVLESKTQIAVSELTGSTAFAYFCSSAVPLLLSTWGHIAIASHAMAGVKTS